MYFPAHFIKLKKGHLTLRTVTLIRRISVVNQYSGINSAQLMSKQRTESQEEEQPLTSEDWNFTGIPQEELWIAEIWEYCREIKIVREAFNNWLEQPVFIYLGSYNNPDGSSEYGFEQTGKTVRESLLMHKLPCVDSSLKVDYSDLIESAPTKVACHFLMRIMPLLGKWPGPYKISRSAAHFEHNLASVLNELSEEQSVRWAKKTDFSRQPSEDSVIATVVINRRATKKNLQKCFAEMCAPLLSAKRGRKEKLTPPLVRLKQLAALRLLKRVVAPSKQLLSFEKLEIELQRLDPKNENKILPSYANAKGFKAAAKEADKYLLNYKKYTKYPSVPVEDRPYTVFGGSETMADFC